MRILFMAVVTLLSAPAMADEIRFDGGMVSGFGLGEVRYAFSPAEQVQLEAGFGGGVDGVHGSFVPKLVYGRGRTRVLAGAGVAVGNEGFIGVSERGPMAWLLVEAFGIEYRLDSGMIVAGGAGFAIGLSGEYCVDCGGSMDYRPLTSLIIPQAHFGLGYAF
jgi:hypothetical protein